MKKIKGMLGSTLVITGLAASMLQGVIQGVFSGSMLTALFLTLPGAFLTLVWLAAPTTDALTDLFSKKHSSIKTKTEGTEFYENEVQEELSSIHHSV